MSSSWEHRAKVVIMHMIMLIFHITSFHLPSSWTLDCLKPRQLGDEFRASLKPSQFRLCVFLQHFCTNDRRCAAHLWCSQFPRPPSKSWYPFFIILISQFSYNILQMDQVKGQEEVRRDQSRQVFPITFYWSSSLCGETMTFTGKQEDRQLDWYLCRIFQSRLNVNQWG